MTGVICIGPSSLFGLSKLWDYEGILGKKIGEVIKKSP